MAASIFLIISIGYSLALPTGKRDLGFEEVDEDNALQSFSDDLSFEFPQLDESFSIPELQRQERDGGFHRHDMTHSQQGERRNGRLRQQQRQSRRQQQQPQQRRRPKQNFQEPERRFQEVRGGRQSGATGLALGVVNNTPTRDGSYDFNFSNDDGTSRQETGLPALVSGTYSFFTPEGELVDMQYTADEFGFHASGSHMPTTPPPPPHVQRLLDHLARVNGGIF